MPLAWLKNAAFGESPVIKALDSRGSQYWTTNIQRNPINKSVQRLPWGKGESKHKSF